MVYDKLKNAGALCRRLGKSQKTGWVNGAAHVPYDRADDEAILGAPPALSALPASAGPVKDVAAHGAWGKLNAEEQESMTHLYTNLGRA